MVLHSKQTTNIKYVIIVSYATEMSKLCYLYVSPVVSINHIKNDNDHTTTTV